MAAALPIVVSIGTSAIMSIDALGIVSSAPTIAPWLRVLANMQVWQSIVFSLYVSTVSVLVATALGIVVSTTPQYRIRKNVGISELILLTIPTVGIGTIVYIVGSGSGVVPRMLHAFGVSGQQAHLYGFVPHAWGLAIILCNVLWILPIMCHVIVGIATTNDCERQHTVAQQLGAQPTQIYWTVTIPMILGKLMPVALLYCVVLFGAYEIPSIVGAQYPRMITVLLFDKLRRFDLANIPEAYVIAVVLCGLSSFVLFVGTVLPLRGRSQ
jgi:putative spermidine/putrescine transport system permease protein